MSKFLYCTNCNNLFITELIKEQVCPIAGCRANSLVELDELIAYQIRELNILGYETDCCCSGHIQDIKDGFCGAYILFLHKEPIIRDIVKKYLSDYIIYKPFKSGLNNETRWILQFKEEYIEEVIGIGPDYKLITEFIDEVNKLIYHLKVAEGYTHEN